MTIKKKKSKHIVVIRICVKINLTNVKINKKLCFLHAKHFFDFRMKCFGGIHPI